MLELRNIKKDYPTGQDAVHALKGINLKFRSAEFVCILGPSGCGKTTMLNIIGGLDKYSEGDLIINKRSTKNFSDRDWDTYRNHSIGFVFQSYNLIPHQTVLQNVELALTLSGVSKRERRKKAENALIQVGLGDQFNKKPNEMSGGQMQRVAIARALVNDPDIILADEPTGALDTETSSQVMDILKNISADKLVIMVTHNPDLAEKYSSRIIRMLDGEIIHDSSPITDEKTDNFSFSEQPSSSHKKSKAPSMSFRTSFMLSLKNLFTKKGRTLLTSFAGSIGIIGIALIIAVSQGTTAYINSVQESTLSAYPLTLEASSVEMSSLIEAFMDIRNDDVSHEKDAVYQKAALYNMINAMSSVKENKNDLKAFKKHIEKLLEDPKSDFSNAVNGIQYSYDLNLQIYTENVDGQIIQSDLDKIIIDFMIKYLGIDMSPMASMSNLGGMFSMSSSSMSKKLWQELLPGKDGNSINDLIYDQYECISGDWPSSYDQIVLVVDENNELDDITLYALGLLSSEDIDKLADASVNGKSIDKDQMSKWSYDSIKNTEYKVILNADCYHYDDVTGLYTDWRNTDAGLRYLYDNALTLKVSGIIRPRDNSDAKMLKGTIAYTSDLTKYLIEKAHDSVPVKAQLDSPNTDIITGLPFNSSTGSLSDSDKENALREYLQTLDISGKASAFIAINSIPPKDFVDQKLLEVLSSLSRDDIENMMSQNYKNQIGLSQQELSDYLASMSDEEINKLLTQLLTQQIKLQFSEQVSSQLSLMSQEQLSSSLDMALSTFTTEQCASYYDEIMVFSDSSYEDNLIELGCLDLDSPSAINLFASSFENKDVITQTISDYNKNVEELKQIKYTDYLGLMMSSITVIINAITYVLIAFVAISLFVSSIMIGVITLISVQERTKEIGILRALGASKKDVASLFNAETMIVGFSSGLLGVIVTYVLCIPLNIILYRLTNIANLKAFLPLSAALFLVVISVLLTLISGIIPSRSAARKDPVVALRTE